MRNVVYREDSSILEVIDGLVKETGTDRSAFIREAVREKLRRICDAREIPKNEQ
jgi:metal-responsive CopG/Arc/MetJ family transcriptional regulator